jgi:hypothetical protein
MAEQLRVVVVVNWKRGSVYGLTTDNEEARRWTRELCDQERDGLAASMTVGLVDIPAPVEAEVEQQEVP